jgi:hypothetical protein
LKIASISHPHVMQPRSCMLSIGSHPAACQRVQSGSGSGSRRGTGSASRSRVLVSVPVRRRRVAGGRTRTTPTPDTPVAGLSFAFASCQRWASGYYSAYRRMAEDDLDFVVHLGDAPKRVAMAAGGYRPASRNSSGGEEASGYLSGRTRRVQPEDHRWPGQGQPGGWPVTVCGGAGSIGTRSR